jgi:hypothetical protein
MNRLNEIKQRLSSITNIKGNGWCVDDEYTDTIRDSYDYELIGQCVYNENNARFIANAPSDVMWLIETLEELDAQFKIRQ